MWGFIGLAAAAVAGLQLFRYQRGLASIVRQLEHIAAGSQIEITTEVQNKSFRRFCRQMNAVLAKHRADENQYQLSQRHLKETISAIAHDIRTPLTSASGYLQMLEECDAGDTSRRERYQQIIGQRLRELKEMLEELFLYTKLTSEGFEIVCSQVAVLPVLSECLVDMYHMFEEKRTGPEVTFENEALQVWASPEGLSRIFRNLVQNALIHGEGPVIIRQQDSVITFTNHIPEGVHVDTKRIFERFYKSDISRRKGTSGLGLAIVRELVQRMGGHVEASLDDGYLAISVCFQAPKGQ